MSLSRKSPTYVEVIGNNGEKMITLAKEVITVSTTVKLLSRVYYLDADRAIITFESADTRVYFDGSTPSSTDGHIYSAGSSLILTSQADIVNFKAIRAGASDSKITVTYSKYADKQYSSGDPVSRIISGASRNAPMNQGLSNGTDTNVTYRILHVATTDLVFPRVALPNWYLNNGETAGPNDITVKYGLEYNGTIYPAQFSGAATSLINPGGTSWSDRIAVVIPKGSLFYSRTNLSVASAGMKWPVSITSYPANGEGKTAGDIAYSGTPTTSFEYCYSPCAIVGHPASNSEPSVQIISDSIGSGQGDSPNDMGWIIRALNNQVNYLRVSKPGAMTSDFLGTNRTNRMNLANYCTHAIYTLAINDIKNGVKLEVIKANVLDTVYALALKGILTRLATATPYTTSTDSWATAQNQTVSAYESVRVAYNEWVRSDPAPCVGHIDVADKLETSRNSGIWVPGKTDDGLHPNTSGHQLAATSLDTRIFV